MRKMYLTHEIFKCFQFFKMEVILYNNWLLLTYRFICEAHKLAHVYNLLIYIS
jgi:hypothetical protein